MLTGLAFTGFKIELKFKPHSEKQERVMFSRKPIIILACGIQFGKTRVGAWRTKMYMHKFTDPEDTFIITAPTYKILQQATLPAFLNIMKGLGKMNKADAYFKMNNGGTCYFRTATDPDSVVGITNCRHIWGDEAGLYPLYFHENLQARAAFKKAPICYTTSPYSLNWIYTDYIRKWHRNPKIVPDVELIQARSDENPYFPKEEFERKKRTMDRRRFNMVFGGEFHKLEGLVYDIFDDNSHVTDQHRTFLDGREFYISGVDWGYTHPAVILTFAVHPQWGVFLVDEVYSTHKTIADLVEAGKRVKAQYGVEKFICDPSSPANILEFNKAGLTALKADNDIRSGVDAMYELMQMGIFKVVKHRAPHFLDEVSIYHYPQNANVTPDKDLKDQLPVKQHDHAMDAARYVCLNLKLTKMGLKRASIVPGMSEIDHRVHAADQALKSNLDTDVYDW